MNKKLVALIASGALLSVAACSSTRTQRAPGEQVDDAALLTSVKSALVSNTVTEAGEINVDVNRGTVKLSGFVDTPKEKSKAGDVARGVDGVKTVQNDIAVQTKNSSTGEAHRRLRPDRQGEDRADRGLGNEGSPDQRRDQAGRCAAFGLRRQRSCEDRSDERRQVRHRCEGRQERTERQVVLTPPRTLDTVR